MKYIYYLLAFIFLSKYFKNKPVFELDSDINETNTIVNKAIVAGLITQDKNPNKNPNNTLLSSSDKKHRVMFRTPNIGGVSRPNETLSNPVFLS